MPTKVTPVAAERAAHDISRDHAALRTGHRDQVRVRSAEHSAVGPARSDDRSEQARSVMVVTERVVHRDVAEDHGGKVTFSSKPGRGTTFTVTIPTAASRPELPVAKA